MTALKRGTANTRWRDFVDIASLARREVDDSALVESIRRVAEFRQVSIGPLGEVLAGYPEIATAMGRRASQAGTRRHDASRFEDLVDNVTTCMPCVVLDTWRHDQRRGGSYRIGNVSSASKSLTIELPEELLQRLDRFARFASAAKLADLSRQDLILDAVERYILGAEMAAPGITNVPLEDPGDSLA